MLQSWEWGEFRRRHKWEPVRLFAPDGGSAVQILLRKLPLPGLGYLAYVPHGPLTEDPADLASVAEYAGTYAAKRGACLLDIEPRIEKADLLEERGFDKLKNTVQPRCTFMIDVLDDPEKQLAALPKDARYGVRRARREGVEIVKAAGAAEVIDHTFIEQNTIGFDAFVACCRTTDWAEIERESGLSQAAIRDAARVYLDAERVIGVYGMGLTQHTHGALNIAMLVNLLLLRGNIGKAGAGCCPVRGHSNVQGQRTVGIAEKAHLVPLDTIDDLFGITAPRDDGYNIVEATEALFEGKVKAFICLGGNLLRAIPDQKRLEQAWQQQDLTVMVSTKLNRSHLFPGKNAYILPCLGRLEADEQASGNQSVTTEDSFSMINASIGKRKPPSEALKSELAIVTGIAKAVVGSTDKLRWDEWTADYGLVRDLIEKTYPDDFHDFNARMYDAGGFYRGNKAHERVWKTDSGKAVITTPGQLNSIGFKDAPGRYRLITLRSNDQFNTTIYGYSDRFRGIEGTRDVLMMNPADIADAGLVDGQTIRLIGDADDGVDRQLGGLTLTAYKLPRGTIAGYYPECNVLVPVGHHDELSKTPASKSVPVRVVADG